jgi:6-phosphogluconolactonase (cycloisomerase 2 family)
VSNGDGNVSVFAVGEDGILTFQQSYQTAGGPHSAPVWLSSDGTGSFLYVLDTQAPDFATTGNGDITVFAVDGTTGRLQLVPNQLIKDPVTGHQLNYFEVGPAPTMLRTGGNCVYTLDSGDQSIYPYGIGSGGQLTVETNSRIKTGGVNITSMNVAANNMYLTDAGTNQILPYTSGAGCSLSAQIGGAVANLPLTANPVYSMTDGKNKFLYVLNSTGTNPNNAGSSISAFVIETTGALVPISDPQNPYAVGNGPTCMIEDPSNQYVFTSNHDGTVTGKFINQNTGQLSDLSRGSTFQSTGVGTCLAVSGNVD